MGQVKILFTNRYISDRGISSSNVTTGEIEDRLKYKVDQLEQISFDGEISIYTIDTSKIRKYEHWLSESYPSEEVKSKVLEITYFAHKGIELKNLAREVEDVAFSDRWSLRLIGEQAITLIKGVNLTTKHIKHNVQNFSFLTSHIWGTLNKEIKYIEGMSGKLNDSGWFNYKVNRRRLAADIENAADMLNYYELAF